MEKNNYVYYHGLCPNCLGIVERKSGICDCGGGEFNFHVANILLHEALCQGVNIIQGEIVQHLPGKLTFVHGTTIRSLDLWGHIKLEAAENKPSLRMAVITEGINVVRRLIAVKQEEVKNKHGVEISFADAATIVVFAHLTRRFTNPWGDLAQNVRVQNLSNVKMNKKGEFVLSDGAFSPGHEITIESENCIITCQPDVKVRCESAYKRGIRAYIKCERSPFVVLYVSQNYPPNSYINIFYRRNQLG